MNCISKLGAILFRTGMTRLIFNDFMSDLQLKKSLPSKTSAFYVDHKTGSIKLVAGVDFDNNYGDEIISFGMDDGGEVVVISPEA